VPDCLPSHVCCGVVWRYPACSFCCARYSRPGPQAHRQRGMDMHACTRICSHAHAYTHACTYTQTHKHTHTHTHTRTHERTRPPPAGAHLGPQPHPLHRPRRLCGAGAAAGAEAGGEWAALAHQPTPPDGPAGGAGATYLAVLGKGKKREWKGMLR